jgi:hypothetical protein
VRDLSATALHARRRGKRGVLFHFLARRLCRRVRSAPLRAREAKLSGEFPIEDIHRLLDQIRSDPQLSAGNGNRPLDVQTLPDPEHGRTQSFGLDEHCLHGKQDKD